MRMETNLRSDFLIIQSLLSLVAGRRPDVMRACTRRTDTPSALAAVWVLIMSIDIISFLFPFPYKINFLAYRTRFIFAKKINFFFVGIVVYQKSMACRTFIVEYPNFPVVFSCYVKDPIFCSEPPGQISIFSVEKTHEYFFHNCDLLCLGVYIIYVIAYSLSSIVFNFFHFFYYFLLSMKSGIWLTNRFSGCKKPHR